jgi:hypothetical protein
VNPAAPEILQDIVRRAKAGDPFAQRAFLTLLPQQSKYVDPPIPDFPLTQNMKEAVAEIAAVTQRMARGELDIDSAHALVEKLKNYVTTYAAVELEDEVAKAKLRVGGA